MSVAARVRKNYQRRPYPSRHSACRPLWRLPAAEWIYSVAPHLPHPPQRILVAGCGTGNEAFALRARFPAAEIVAVDFSPRTIALARTAQRVRGVRLREQPIHFLVGDLTRPQFDRVVRGKFDFITCHGVLSYIEKPAPVLRRLRTHLAADGAFYLGVNGAAHFSARWRQALPQFGFQVEEMPDSPRLGRIIALFDHLSNAGVAQVARRESAYLSGDLFGPLLHNWPLHDWMRTCSEAGFHFAAGSATQRGLRETINQGALPALFPRSRAEVAQLLDLLAPSSFHRLIFTREAERLPPWENSAQLWRWRPVLARHLRHHRWTKTPRAVVTSLRRCQIKIPATNTSIDLRVPDWIIHLLRRSNGLRSLREILSPRPPGAASLRQHLYLLYQLEVLNLEPPAPDARA